MKTLLTIILILASLVFCEAAVAQMNPEWVKSYNGANNPWDRGVSVLHDSQNNIYVGGTSSANGLPWSVFLVKYSPAGNVVWTKTYSSPDPVLMFNMSMDAQNNVYMVGMKNNNLLVIKYNSAGTKLWEATYSDMYGTDVCVTGEGNVFVTGWRFPNSVITVKFNSAGVQQWADIRTMEDQAHANRIRVDANGNVFVLAMFGDFDLLDPVIFKYNNNTGQVQGAFIVTADSLIGCNPVADMEIDNAGNIYVSASGYYSGTLDHDIFTFKLSPSLNLLWKKRYAGPGGKNDKPHDLHVDKASGLIYIAGETWSSNLTMSDFITIKYLSSGVEQWHKVYNSTNDTDIARCIDVDETGAVYVTGVTKNNGEEDITTIKYTLLGTTMVWKNEFSGSTEDWPADMDLDNNGNVYVTGSTTRFLNDDKDMILFKLGTTVGIQQLGGEIPSKFQLEQNYPNPFNPVTNIKFSIPRSGSVKLVVFDAAGKEVAELVNDNLSAGSYNFDFNASHLSSGVYFYKLTGDGFNEVKKMILVK